MKIFNTEIEGEKTPYLLSAWLLIYLCGVLAIGLTGCSSAGSEGRSTGSEGTSASLKGTPEEQGQKSVMDQHRESLSQGQSNVDHLPSGYGISQEYPGDVGIENHPSVEIGRASCRERLEISTVTVTLNTDERIRSTTDG